MYKGVGLRFTYFISFFLNMLNIPWKWNNLVSLRPNYFIFMGYLKTGDGEGVLANHLNPLWIFHWHHSYKMLLKLLIHPLFQAAIPRIFKNGGLGGGSRETSWTPSVSTTDAIAIIKMLLKSLIHPLFQAAATSPLVKWSLTISHYNTIDQGNVFKCVVQQRSLSPYL